MVDYCTVTGKISDIFADAVGELTVQFRTTKSNLYRSGEDVVSTKRRRAKTDDFGNLSVDLVPGEYTITLKTNSQGGDEAKIVVPDTSTANLASIMNLTPPPPLSDAEQAVLDAQAKAALSKSWANTVEDVVVESGEYSSKHYSLKSAALALTATSKASEAANSAQAALSHKNDASGSADAASGAATNASAAAGAAIGARDDAVQRAQEATAAAAQAAFANASTAEKAVLVHADADRAKDDADRSTTQSNAASLSATLSQRYANDGEDVEIASGQFSSRHYSIKAANSAGLANTKANDASSSASAAAAAFSDVQTAANNAENSKNLAAKWAGEIEDTPVETGKFSALHHSAKSAAQAGVATQQATNAVAAKNASEAARDTASSHKDAAASSASSSASSASSAATSAFNADAKRALAAKWAEEAEDVEVEAGKHSALHYAAKASASATEVNDALAPVTATLATMADAYADQSTRFVEAHAFQ